MSVVVGYVHRPELRPVLDLAAKEARLRRTPLHVVIAVAGGPTSHEGRARAWGSDLAHAEEVGRELREELAAAGIEAVMHVAGDAQRDAAAHLLAVAEEVRATIIVIGIRRRTPVGKLVLGSVARDVLLHAQMPVLGVPV